MLEPRRPEFVPRRPDIRSDLSEFHLSSSLVNWKDVAESCSRQAINVLVPVMLDGIHFC